MFDSATTREQFTQAACYFIAREGSRVKWQQRGAHIPTKKPIIVASEVLPTRKRRTNYDPVIIAFETATTRK